MKNNRKKSHSAEKKLKVLFSLVRFCKCSKKFLAKARSRTRDRWVHRKASKVCTKKWYIHDEVCCLTKKRKELATVIVGFFSLEKRLLRNNYIKTLETVYILTKWEAEIFSLEISSNCIKSVHGKLPF